LPVMVNMDGFTLSHVIEPIIIPDQAEVDAFLPPFEPVFRLDPANPLTLGPVGVPEIYTELRRQLEEALAASLPVIEEHWAGFAEQFGRTYKSIETYKMDGAETALLTMGSISETAMTAVDEMQAEGKKVGLIRIRLWRPFPIEAFLAAIAGLKQLVVIDRALSYGGAGGPVATEIRAYLCGRPDAPPVASYITGLGGRDVTRDDFKEMAQLGAKQSETGKLFEFFGVREE